MGGVPASVSMVTVALKVVLGRGMVLVASRNSSRNGNASESLRLES